jgi:hypothetical protein
LIIRWLYFFMEWKIESSLHGHGSAGVWTKITVVGVMGTAGRLDRFGIHEAYATAANTGFGPLIDNVRLVSVGCFNDNFSNPGIQDVRSALTGGRPYVLAGAAALVTTFTLAECYYMMALVLRCALSHDGVLQRDAPFDCVSANYGANSSPTVAVTLKPLRRDYVIIKFLSIGSQHYRFRHIDLATLLIRNPGLIG